MDFVEALLIWVASCFPFFIPLIIPTGSYGFYKHAARHTDGTDDIRDATTALKGLMTAAQVTELEGFSALKKIVILTDTARLLSLTNQGDVDWTDLDMNTVGSSLIPTRAIAVLLTLRFRDDAAPAITHYGTVRKKGETDFNQQKIVFPTAAGVSNTIEAIIGLDTNGFIQYKIEASGASSADFDIFLTGWIESI